MNNPAVFKRAFLRLPTEDQGEFVRTIQSSLGSKRAFLFRVRYLLGADTGLCRRYLDGR